jgi:hypothetical protein
LIFQNAAIIKCDPDDVRITIAGLFSQELRNFTICAKYFANTKLKMEHANRRARNTGGSLRLASRLPGRIPAAGAMKNPAGL